MKDPLIKSSLYQNFSSAYSCSTSVIVHEKTSSSPQITSTCGVCEWKSNIDAASDGQAEKDEDLKTSGLVFTAH